MNMKNLLVGKQMVLLMVLAIVFFPLKNSAQDNKADIISPLKRIGEIVRDKNGNPLYQIEESIKYGYIYRLILRSNTLLTDSITGLQWRSKPRASFYEPKHSWYDTQAWVNEIQDGWRLPTLEELKQFFDNHYRWHAIVWSSKEHENDKDKAHFFDMDGGQLKDFTGKISYTVARKDFDIGQMMNCTPLAVREAIQNRVTKYALKVTPLTSDIKPDGETTVQISAQLYSYTPGDNSSSKPVAGKSLSIEINDLDRIKPGVLSATSATTDNNGIVTFNYTAPIAETLEQMEPMNRLGTTIKISNGELKVEDLAYISFVTDKGKIWVVPGMSMLSDTGFVPPDKRYPALISANFYEGNMEPVRNTDVIFSIRENNPVGMLCSSDGREGKQIALKTDANGAACVLYYYAASTPPDKRITETIEAKTTNMSAPFKAYVSTGFNLVINDAISGYESSKEINAGEEIPLKITVKDAWNPGFNLEEMMNHWGFGGNTGSNKLYVKLEIEKQGFVPGYLLDLMGEKNFPEPLYEEMLRPRNMGEFKNLLYIPEYSAKKAGFPLVKPQFSGVNNYEIRVLLTDEVGKTIFESPNPRRFAFLSIPTGVSADAFSIWFASNPLGPHTELARFARMLLSTISLGKYGGFGSILSLADAAFAINSGDAEALIAVLLSEIKGKVLGDVSENGELSGEIIGEYGNMSIAEQYLSYGLTTYSDLGLIAQMENKVLSGIAGAAFRSDTKMVVLKGDGTQKLFSTMEADTNSGSEIPVEEGKYVRDEKLKTISLKNGKVTVYVVPYEMNIISENASEMNIY